MIPAKRQSPFTRTRSFQPSSNRQRIDTGTAGGPPFSKRPGFARTMSTPFQVLSPTMSSSRNPFEKLAPSPTASPTSASSPSTFVSEYASLRIAEDKSDPEDEAMDPKSTLKMFSFSQPTPSLSTKLIKEENEDSSSDEELEDDLDLGIDCIEPEADEIHTLTDQKPRLQEALEKSLSAKKKSIGEISAPSSSTASMPKKARGELKSSTALPMDWTLKSAIFLTSPDSFAWCDEGSTAMDEIAAMQLFMSGVSTSGDGPTCDRKKPSPRIRFLSAMYHWIYPTNAATSSQSHSINRLLKNAETLDAVEKSNVTEIFSRTGEWRQSFKSVYQMYRNGACPYFYYVGSSWTILFQHGSISTSGDLEAILTNSTPGLRKVLGEEDISFVRLPDAGGKTAVFNFSSKHDLQGLDDENPGSESTSSSGTPFQLPAQQDLSNTLLFQGPVEVQGLFSYLIGQKLSFEDGFMYSSPRLIANVPFLHAALKSNTVSKCRLVSRNIEGTDMMQKEYRVEIHGTVLPTSAQDLCRICSDQQQLTGYKFTAQSDPRSYGLNLRPLYKIPGSDPVPRTRSATRLSEDSFVSTKSLDQFRFDSVSNSYSWST